MIVRLVARRENGEDVVCRVWTRVEVLNER
jgi:hypothetical protein